MVQEPPSPTTNPIEADLADGASVTFSNITFSDGTTIELALGDVVVLVGPNNAGKSRALHELGQSHRKPQDAKVVENFELRRSGTPELFQKLFFRMHKSENPEDDEYYGGNEFPATPAQIKTDWESGSHPHGSLHCVTLKTEDRIKGSNPALQIAILDEPPAHPIHHLFGNDNAEKRIGSYFKRAFGKSLTLFRLGGKHLPLRVGDIPDLVGGEDRLSASYISRLRDRTEPLMGQGDGMRAFATVLLGAMASKTQTIILLDEPEAFLHPAHARLLVECVANEVRASAQLFIATHSADVLEGLLNAAPDRLRVLRIQRAGSVNTVRELDKTRVKEISTSSLMKYSSVLSGLFHQRVIICDSDADCMFYRAILDLKSVRGALQPDVLFVHGGGMGRMAKLAKALLDLDVHVDIIVDVDMLKDAVNMPDIIKTMGGKWSDFRKELTPITKAIEQADPPLESTKIVEEIRRILETVAPQKRFPRKIQNDIWRVMRKASNWSAIKSGGEAEIPPSATQHYSKIKELCTKCHVWIVPVGELEGFCSTETAHGPKWARNVIEKYDLEADEFHKARDFVRQIWDGHSPVAGTAPET